MKTIRLLFFALLCAVAQGALATDYSVGTDSELRAAIANDGANIIVTADIDLSNSTLSIESGTTVTIDLGGHTLDRQLTQRGEGGGQVITVRSGATLILSNGTLRGGWGGAGGALVNEGGMVTLTDVITVNNVADDRGGGICNREGGTLTMNGGVITNNHSNDQSGAKGGGGFFNEAGATATLTGVTITGNEATVCGGGGICNFGTLTLDGCILQNNAANTYGGGIWQEGTLNMQGTNTINDNRKPDGLRSNLYLKNGMVINITGALASSHVSVGMETLGTFTSGYSTYNDGHPAGFFTSDKPAITGMRLVNGEALLDNAIPEGGVYYIERSWNETTQCVEATYHTLEENQYITLTGSDDDTYLDPGWYVVKGSDVVYDDYLYMNGGGEYHLILCDGASIKAMFFIVESPNILHIHGQADNTGKMISTYVYNFVAHKCAGIGGTDDNANGPIFIHGGDIDVHATLSSAGIGGGGYASQGGAITIYGGTVRAQGGYEPGGSAGSGSGGGAGIGGGRNGDGGIVNIYGGSVYATGKGSTSGAAGIGSGSYAESSGTISIYGGYVEAKGYYGSAGIGGGQGTNGADVTIHGGTVKAEGKTEGPGIGAGKNDDNSITYAGTLTVTGGKVYAYGGSQRGAGIGGGWNTNGSNVTISGGYVYAEGGKYAAGIGSGCEYISGGERHGGTLTVTGGYVEAHGGVDGAGIGGGEDADGGTVNISGGEVRAYGNANGAGIGGGENGTGGNVTITGGIVIAESGGDQRAIGAGYGSSSHGSLNLAENLGVFVTTNLNRSVKANRVIDCRNFKYVRINQCAHGNATFADNGSSVSVDCPYCYTSTRPYTFKANGNWNDGSKWFAGYMPHEGKDVDVKARATIPNNCIANVGNIALQDGGTITIADGGQLIHKNNGVTATVQKAITGHGGNNNGGWNFIASPMVTTITPAATNGFLTEDYDLYYYDEPTHYWMNHKGSEHGHFDIEPQKGYLYASQANTTLNMAGTLQPSNEPVTISGLSHEASVLTGFNLVGNPFACNATIDRPFYVIDGNHVVAYEGSEPITPGTGVMVQADTNHESVTFTKVTPETQASQPNNGSLQIALTQANTRSNARIDNAIVSFNEGVQLEKFCFGNDAKVYIPQGDKDYAIAFSEGQGEMPINFKATENGEYTISVTPEGVEMNYLHLIDNMTGADVDLLVSEPVEGPASYTFTAKTNDYESRFKLVFATNDENGPSTGSGTFAFNSNGNWIISNEGEATLQVIDINGRILSSESINGSVSKVIDVAPGVYILKLNDKVQKIVIR